MTAIGDPSEFSVYCPICRRFQCVGELAPLVGIGQSALDGAHYDTEHSLIWSPDATSLRMVA